MGQGLKAQADVRTERGGKGVLVTVTLTVTDPHGLRPESQGSIWTNHAVLVKDVAAAWSKTWDGNC